MLNRKQNFKKIYLNYANDKKGYKTSSKLVDIKVSSKYKRTDIEFEEKHIQDNTNFILFYYNLQLRNLRKGKKINTLCGF